MRRFLKQRKAVLLLLSGALFITLGWFAVGFASAWSEPSGLRIGTFRRTELLVAYYRSAVHAESLQRIEAERDKAKAAGDDKRVSEIEGKGGAMQETAHQQLAGVATLDNIQEALKNSLKEVAQKADVAIIVEQPWFVDPSVTLIDVTDSLIAQLPSAKAKSEQK